MESSEQYPDRAEARSALAEAQAASGQWAGDLVLPSYFYSSLGVGLAVLVASFAWWVVSSDNYWATGVYVAGMALFGVIGEIQLVRFRRANGVLIAGLSKRVVFGMNHYTFTIAAGLTVIAAVAGLWWLVPFTAAFGGALYAWAGRRWWRSYLNDPARLGRDKYSKKLHVLNWTLLCLTIYLALRIGR